MWNLKKTIRLIALPSIAAIMCPLPSTGTDSSTNEYLTRSGKAIIISESHPIGQSLSDITVKSAGFEHNLSEAFKDIDPVKNVHIADLDNNGFDEIYIITVSSGSGSYGKVIAFASNQDKSLSMIHFPIFQEDDEFFAGYMGHDTFSIDENALVRSFPIYLSSDTNNNPTGGTRRVNYGLIAGEAAWQLKITDAVDVR